MTPLWHVAGLEAEGVRRPPERRHRRRHRAVRARGLPLGRAPQAIHDARHGDRPGQNRQCQRHRHHGGVDRTLDRRDRNHDVPAALHAGCDRRAGRPSPRQGSSARRGSRPTHAWAKEQGAVFVETGLWLRAQYFPRARERDWRESVDREVRTVRSARRILRRLDPRQDRRPGSGCGCAARSPLHQHLLDLAGRTGALRRDAARGRIRARRRHDVAPGGGSLLHDHDHRQRRAGLPAHAVLPSGVVAGARRAIDAGNRPVGAVLDRGAARARHAGGARRSAVRYRQRRIPASWRPPS